MNVDCDKLKEWLKEFLDNFHDTIVSVTEEDKDWYDIFYEETEELKNKLNRICELK